MKKKILKNKKGFTLIEIIAVLVILGILAAIAIPKYISLQQDAAQKSADAAITEGVSQVNLFAVKYILQQNTAPTNLAGLVTVGLVNPYTEGDWTIDFADTDPAGSIKIDVTGKAGTNVVGTTKTKTIPLPQ
ncbi:MAG: hypothetical protein A2073_04635 [Deltaproteobacteria bacterium GWC2_42_11]|nr:MAG: hypothetical protein A2073_04635 [Deltaproteobacteria bacterium GWC2_42_11]